VNDNVSVDSSCGSGKCGIAGWIEGKVGILESETCAGGRNRVGTSDAIDGKRSVVLRVVNLSNCRPDVGVGSVEGAGNHDVGECHQSPGGDDSISRVTEIHHDSHSSVLVFEGDFEDGEGVEGLGAGGLEATEGESIA
jgi:hypothetical protein